MLGIIVILVVTITSIWIYMDAKKNKIGKISDEKSMFNLSAGEWAAGSLLLWIIVFPVYLIKRKSLIEKAKEFPTEIKRRGLKTLLLSSIIFFIIIIIAVPSYLKSTYNNQEIDQTRVNNQPLNNTRYKNNDVFFPGVEKIETREQYIESCKKVDDQRAPIYYKELLKNPDKFKGVRIKTGGKIREIAEKDNKTVIQIYITHNLDSVIVYYPNSSKFYKDDLIIVYGEGIGSIEGKNKMGVDNSWPAVKAKYIEKYNAKNWK